MAEDITIRERLVGAREFIRDALASAAATQKLAQATEQAGRQMQRANHHGFAYNQTLFTMRRYLYNTTLAATAMGAAAGAVGFKMAATLERTEVALDFLSKGSFNAKDELREFLDIARDTAFLPQEVISIGQSFIAMGFSAGQTNRTLRATGDAIAALNLPHATTDRVLFALGQIRTKGKLYGEEIRQLANANIPVWDYLAEAFGKNVTQLNRIADAGIPAEAAWEAIVGGMERQFNGASARIAQTTSGQFEILKGDFQIIMAGIVDSTYNTLGKALHRITDVTKQMTDAILHDNASFMDLVRIVDDATGGAYHLERVFKTLNGHVKAAYDIWKTLLDVMMPFAKAAFVTALALLYILQATAWFIDKGGKPLILILQLLVAWWIIERLVMKGVWLWTMRTAAAKAIATFWTKRLTAVTKILNIFTWRNARLTRMQAVETMWEAKAAQHAAVMEARRARVNDLAVTPSIWRLVAAQIAALATNPFVLIAVATVALAGALVYLWYKFEKLRPLIGYMMMFLSPLTLLFLLLGDKLHYVADAFERVGGWFDKLENWMPDWGQASGLDIFGGGGGGAGGVPGLSAAGAPVMPETMNTQQIMSQMGMQQIEAVPVNIDGKQFAELMFTHKDDRMARR